jgi:cardiolipin synthase
MNLPNLLTAIRFMLIPVFFAVFYSDLPNNITLSMVVFIIAGITDILDGYIARNYNMVTKWGIIFDPVADKSMLLSVLYALTDADYLPVWIIIVVAGKELFMAAGAAVLYFTRNKTVVPANNLGKAATILFYLSLIALVIELPFGWYLLIVAVLVTITAFIKYANNFRNIKKSGL